MFAWDTGQIDLYNGFNFNLNTRTTDNAGQIDLYNRSDLNLNTTNTVDTGLKTPYPSYSDNPDINVNADCIESGELKTPMFIINNDNSTCHIVEDFVKLINSYK
jgi:hypothetical protein